MAERVAVDIDNAYGGLLHRTLCAIHYEAFVLDADMYWEFCNCQILGHKLEELCSDCENDEIGYPDSIHCMLCGSVVADGQMKVHTDNWDAHFECVVLWKG